MRFIGITGGVGAGKSAILAHLASKPGIRVMLADEIAHDLMQPGTECFQKLKEKFAGEDIYQPDGSLDRAQLATVIFSDDRKREELNAIVHPAVREYVLQQKEAEERAGKLFLLVLEAALLIEEHYDEICDTVSSYSTKDVKFTLKKSSLKKKKFDLRNATITRKGGAYYYR